MPNDLVATHANTIWLGLGLLGGLLLLAAWSRPHWPVATLNMLRKLAGWQRHTIGVDGFELVYYECGRHDAPPMLLLHGFAGEADNWLFFAPHFKKHYRIIIPDLPGFGGTGFLEGMSYSLDAQLARIKDLADMLHLTRFQLLGNSMGGYFAAAFAARHPERVSALGLLNAAGVDMPRRSPFYEAALQGDNLLLTRNRADFERVLKLVYHKVPWLPGYLKQAMAEQRSTVADDQNLIFQEVFGQRVWLDDALAKISAPTLVLWGDDDRVLDISSIECFQAGIRHAEVGVLPACGHLPMLEKPKETARIWRDFIARQPA